jgi:nucleoside-diphosphate-sugar epimerase
MPPVAENIAYMEQANLDSWIIGPDEPILITGAGGFIGARVVKDLLDRGFRHIRCFIRSSSGTAFSELETLADRCGGGARVELIKGNLLSLDDCRTATKDAAVIYHLAAGRGEKSYPDAFMNSVVTTRNLLEAAVSHKHLRRFVNVSSFAVYSNRNNPRRRVLDETCPVEPHPEHRGEAYCFAKVKQEEIVKDYAKTFGLPHVIVRPGCVYGPGNLAITGRVGIRPFGVFLHLGGGNTIPFTYVDNCASAIALAGLKRDVDGEVFNVVDDDLPSSRRFLRQYNKNVERIRSIYIPHSVSYAMCRIWQKYSTWSQDQLPLAFNVGRWHANWKRTHYSNAKLKRLLGWTMQVPTAEGLRRYFNACKEGRAHA